MRFCKDCGTPLNLFGNRDNSLCSACVQHKKRADKQQTAEKTNNEDDFQILRDTTLTVENGKIIIRSKEGWELWSSHVNEKIEMNTLLARAKKIYQIRLKRQKN